MTGKTALTLKEKENKRFTPLRVGKSPRRNSPASAYTKSMC